MNSLTLGKFNGKFDRVLGISGVATLGNNATTNQNFNDGSTVQARPSITLKNGINLAIDSGNGTIESPYEIN